MVLENSLLFPFPSFLCSHWRKLQFWETNYSTCLTSITTPSAFSHSQNSRFGRSKKFNILIFCETKDLYLLITVRYINFKKPKNASLLKYGANNGRQVQWRVLFWVLNVQEWTIIPICAFGSTGNYFPTFIPGTV